MTAPACSAAFSISGSRSILAASTACTVSGIARSPRSRPTAQPSSDSTSTPLSRSSPTSSSRKNGLPSARCTSRSRSSPVSSGSFSSRSCGHGAHGQRVEPEHRRVALPGPPRRPQVEDLRPRGRDEHHGRARVRDEPFEEVEQVRLGPVDVLDEEDRRTVGRRAPRRTRLRRACSRSRASSGWRSGATSSPRASARISRPAETRDDLIRGRPLAQPEVLAHHLAERPVRDPRAVGKTPSGAIERRRVLLGERVPELAHEPGLADARLADDRHEVRLGLRRSNAGTWREAARARCPDRRRHAGARPRHAAAWCEEHGRPRRRPRRLTSPSPRPSAGPRTRTPRRPRRPCAHRRAPRQARRPSAADPRR